MTHWVKLWAGWSSEVKIMIGHQRLLIRKSFVDDNWGNVNRLIRKTVRFELKTVVWDASVKISDSNFISICVDWALNLVWHSKTLVKNFTDQDWRPHGFSRESNWEWSVPGLFFASQSLWKPLAMQPLHLKTIFFRWLKFF